jgi:uncharacterized protein (UPF0210 family)
VALDRRDGMIDTGCDLDTALSNKEAHVMKRIATIVTMVSIMLATSPVTAPSQSALGTGQETLARELKRAWLPLESAMVVSRSAGTPISAKYEIDDGAFQVSVYTVKDDTFAEVIVDYNSGTVAKVDQITDGGDLAAARGQKEAMARATRSLEEATAEAVRLNPGYRAVSALPRLSEGHPIVDVVLINGTDWRAVVGRLD